MGDTNRDGIPDVVVGAPGINGFFIYSGIDGRELRKAVGDSTVTDLGRGVAGVGDLNRDGYADILASAPAAASGKGASTGRVYVFSGKDGKPLLTLDGEKAGDSFGSTLGVSREPAFGALSFHALKSIRRASAAPTQKSRRNPYTSGNPFAPRHAESTTMECVRAGIST